MTPAQLGFPFDKKQPTTRTKAEGHEAATDPFSDIVLQQLRDSLIAYAKRGREFTVEGWQGALPSDLWEYVEKHGNVKGFLFTWASEHTNQIVKTGKSVKSVRAAARGRALPLWRFNA